MDDALRRRLDAALALLLANFLLSLAVAYRFAPESTLGVLALVGLVAYGHFRSG